MKSRICLWCAIIGCGVGFQFRGFAAELRVPSEFQTIQMAVNAAQNADTIMIEPGTYLGPGNMNVSINGKAIYVESLAGAGQTILDAENAGRAFIISNDAGGESRFSGLTIQNCRADVMGAVQVSSGAKAVFRDCVVHHCQMDGSGLEGGAFLVDASELTLESISISDCSAKQGGGVHLMNNSRLEMASSTVKSCDGCGLFIHGNSEASVTDCEISFNTSTNFSYTGGVNCFEDSDLVLDRCTLIGNRNDYTGSGAVRVDQSSFRISNCIIAKNFSTLTGSGMVFRNQAQGELVYCTISDNTSDVDGVLYVLDSSVSVKNGILWNEGSAVEISKEGSATFTVIYSDVRGGHPGAGNTNIDPGVDDSYHLTGESECIDAGIGVGINVDIDGESRPNGLGCDIGADEFYKPAETRVQIDMPGNLYNPGNTFYLKLTVSHQGEALESIPVFCILDIMGSYYFWPLWNDFSYEIRDFTTDFQEIFEVLPEFKWPAGAGDIDGVNVYGACTDAGITRILGEFDMVTFGWRN